MKSYTILLIIMGVIVCGLILVGSFGCVVAPLETQWVQGNIGYYYDSVHNVGVWYSLDGDIEVLPADNISNPDKPLQYK